MVDEKLVEAYGEQEALPLLNFPDDEERRRASEFAREEVASSLRMERKERDKERMEFNQSIINNKDAASLKSDDSEANSSRASANSDNNNSSSNASGNSSVIGKTKSSGTDEDFDSQFGPPAKRQKHAQPSSKASSLSGGNTIPDVNDADDEQSPITTPLEQQQRKGPQPSESLQLQG